MSYGTDEHALAVLSALPSTYDALLIDVGREGVDFVSSFSDEGRLFLTTKSGIRYDLSNVKFWWNRRPKFQAHPETRAPYSIAQEAETMHFWTGVFGLELGGHWCNAPRAHLHAQNKLVQIFLAKECGLRTPRTLWSNDPAAIQEFWMSCGQRSVIKMFEGSEKVWQPTRLLSHDEFQNSRYLRFSHAIVQEEIDGDREYRIVIFGDYAFSVASDVGRSRYPYDTRIDTATRGEKITICPNLLARLREFRTRAGLSYCAFDVRENACGEPVFLENNPMGQFLFLDRVHGGALLRAFASFMASFGKADEVSCDSARSEIEWEGGIDLPHFAASGRMVSHIVD